MLLHVYVHFIFFLLVTIHVAICHFLLPFHGFSRTTLKNNNALFQYLQEASVIP